LFQKDIIVSVSLCGGGTTSSIISYPTQTELIFSLAIWWASQIILV